MSLIATDKITVREFLEMDAFEEGYLYELIFGEIVKRTSPNTEHQRVSKRLFKRMDDFIEKNDAGECFYAPYDVVFDEENLALPDIIFVSKQKKEIIKKGCIVGVPDLLVEILSPGTYKNDRGGKMKLYKQFEVAEYWIVDPGSRSIEVYVWENGDYDLLFFAIESGEVESRILPGLKIDPQDIFG